MKRNALLVVLLVAIGALVVVAVRQRGEIRDLRAVQERVSPPVVSAKATPEPPKEEPVAAPKAVEPVPAPAPEAAPPPAAPASTNATSNYFAGLAGMMKNPQMKEMIRVQQKVMLDRMYGSLSNYLNLTTVKLDALKELLMDRQMAMADSGMAMMAGSESDRKQAIEQSKAIKSDYDKKFQELLGPQDYPVFQQYEQTSNERMSVQMFKQSLPADAALTDQQEDSLITAMYEERKALPASSLINNKNADPSQLTEERIAELEKQMEQLQQKYAERAAAILTPAQLDQFATWQKQWNAMQAAGLKMAAQMFGNKAAPQPQSPPANQAPTP